MTKRTGRPRGRPPKGEERGIGTKFIEDVILKKYKTAYGAVSEIEALLPKMSEADQGKLHLRLLELYTKILPRDLRVKTEGFSVVLNVHGVSPKERVLDGEVIESSPPSLPPRRPALSSQTVDPKLYVPSTSPEIRDRDGKPDPPLEPPQDGAGTPFVIRVDPQKWLQEEEEEQVEKTIKGIGIKNA